MPHFYRIVQAQWAANAMDGEGARRYGGRWNEAGIPAVYLAESRALAALEILVHAPREALMLDWVILNVEVPDEMIERAQLSKLPKTWRDQPSSPAAQTIGTNWLRTFQNFALRLPSVIIPEETTLLLNSRHPGMRDIKISKPRGFSFDGRLTAR